jgi:uncharacterized membrane protein YtjA (UPF0391 family)
MGLPPAKLRPFFCWCGWRREAMLKGALVFLVIGLMAALLGFTTIAGASFAIAKLLAGIFLFIFLVLLVMALFVTKAV